MSTVNPDAHDVKYLITYSLGGARRYAVKTIHFTRSLNEDQVAKLSEHNFVLNNALRNNPAPENGVVDGSNFNPVSLTGNEANGVQVKSVEVKMPDGDAVIGEVTITVTKGLATRTFLMPTEFAQSQNYRRLREMETIIKANLGVDQAGTSAVAPTDGKQVVLLFPTDQDYPAPTFAINAPGNAGPDGIPGNADDVAAVTNGVSFAGTYNRVNSDGTSSIGLTLNPDHTVTKTTKTAGPDGISGNADDVTTTTTIHEQIRLVSITRTTNNLDSATNTYSIAMSIGGESYTFSLPITFAKSYNQYMLDKLVYDLTHDVDKTNDVAPTTQTPRPSDADTLGDKFVSHLNIADMSVAHTPTISELSYAGDATVIISRLVKVDSFNADAHQV